MANELYLRTVVPIQNKPKPRHTITVTMSPRTGENRHTEVDSTDRHNPTDRKSPIT